MADVKWIKIVTDVFDDEKILLIDCLPERDAIIVIWFKMLCLAGKQNNGGLLMLNDKIPYTDEMLATIFRRPVNTVRLALDTFEKFGMIEIINNTIFIPKWDKHQSLEKLEKIREQTRKRVAKHAAKKKALAQGSAELTQTNALANADVTQQIRKEEEKKRTDKEVEVAEATDGNCISDDDKLKPFNNILFFSENQTGHLLELMGLEMFNEYCARLEQFIMNNDADVKSHYKTILKWYKEDCNVEDTTWKDKWQ